MNQFAPVLDARPNDSVWPQMTWPPTEAAQLVGQFVELLPCDPERDASSLFQVLNHDAVWAHLPGRPLDANGYAHTLKQRIADGRFPWVVRLRQPCAGMPAGSTAGTSSYLDAHVDDARLEIGATAYTPAVWATQVNPETKLLLLSYAFDHLRVGRVELKTDVRNVRSQAAIARLGAKYEGTLRRHKRRDDGTIRDSVVFSIIAEDWPAVRDNLNARLKR